MSNVCIACVKEKSLKDLVFKTGSRTTCTLCGENNLSLHYEDRNLFSLVKAIVRFNYSEWEYNTHWGGDGYEALFYGQDNIFFSQERALSEDLYEDFILSITNGPVYEDYDKGISVYSGHSSGMQNMLLQSIKSSLDSNIVNLEVRLRSENYFKVEAELINIINKYVGVAEKKLDAGSTFYRARIGVNDRKREFGSGFEAEYNYAPYSQASIGAPPPYLAGAGRINRPGVSFFYCATDTYTAVTEVRPHPGDLVSIGKFSLKKNVTIFNLSENLLLNFYNSDEILETYISLNTLSNYMNKVIPPSERQQYSFTQLIADCIRQKGFDGIAFNSTVGNGDNIVLFDPSIVNYSEDEAGVFEVEKIKYVLKPAKSISEDGVYL